MSRFRFAEPRLSMAGVRRLVLGLLSCGADSLACLADSDCSPGMTCIDFEERFVTRTETCTASAAVFTGLICVRLCQVGGDQCEVLGPEYTCSAFGCSSEGW